MLLISWILHGLAILSNRCNFSAKSDQSSQLPVVSCTFKWGVFLVTRVGFGNLSIDFQNTTHHLQLTNIMLTYQHLDWEKFSWDGPGTRSISKVLTCMYPLMCTVSMCAFAKTLYQQLTFSNANGVLPSRSREILENQHKTLKCRAHREMSDVKIIMVKRGLSKMHFQ